MKRLHEHRRQSPVSSVIFTARQDRLRCSTAVYSHLCELAWERVSAAAGRGASRLWSPRTRPTGWRCKLSLNMWCEQLPSVHCTGLQGSRSIEALPHVPRCLQKLSDSTNIPVRDVWERRDPVRVRLPKCTAGQLSSGHHPFDQLARVCHTGVKRMKEVDPDAGCNI